MEKVVKKGEYNANFPSTETISLQKKREAREKENAKWKAINDRAKLKAQGNESVTEYGRVLFNENAEKISIGLGILLEDLLENPHKPGPHFAAWPLLLHVTNRGPRTISSIALSVVLDTISSRPYENDLAKGIGRALEDELRAGKVEKMNPHLMRLIKKKKGAKALSNKRILQQLRIEDESWTNIQKQEVGGLLLQVIVANTNLIEILPLSNKGKIKTIVDATKATQEIIKRNPPKPTPVRRLPLLIKPKPCWTMYRRGENKPFIRSRNDIDYITERDLRVIKKPVHYLEDQAVEIDRTMVSDMRTAWDCNIRGLFPVQRDPKEEPVAPTEHIGSEAYKNYVKERWDAQKDRNNGAAIRNKIEQDIRELEEVAGRTVYNQYFADQRGRIYTLNKLATHQGPDWSKACISFAKGKRCSEEGFSWLLIAAAGHYGINDVWLERHKWGEDHIKQMCAVAEAPLDRLELWRDAKDKWQYLQLCRAVKEQIDNPNSISKCPIRLDQCCSGVAISSMLTGDYRLAAWTNCVGDRKSDLYQVVADHVHLEVTKDLQSNPTKKKFAELWLGYGIDRSLMKLPCMTAIYGAQYLGLVDYLVARLEEKAPDKMVYDWQHHYLSPAGYLAKIIKSSLDNYLNSSFRLQKWLKLVAKQVLEQNKKIRWTSPVGWPIELGDEIDPRKSVHSLTRGKRRWTPWNEYENKDLFSARITKRSIMANTITSFDAAMCLQVVSTCSVQNVQILTNHDCFATIPTDAEYLHKLLLKQLGTTFKQKWLKKIRSEIIANTGIKNIDGPPVEKYSVGFTAGENPYAYS